MRLAGRDLQQRRRGEHAARPLDDVGEGRIVAVAEGSGDVAACGYAALETSQRFRRHAQHIALNFMVVLEAHRGRGLAPSHVS